MLRIFRRDSEPNRENETQQKLANIEKRYNRRESQPKHLEIKTVNDIRFGVLGSISDAFLEEIAEVYPNSPQGSNICFAIAEFFIDEYPEKMSSIYSKDTGIIVNGNHCINVYPGYVIDFDMTTRSGNTFDVFILQVDTSPTTPPGPNTIQPYLQKANDVYGGNWQYFGKEKHRQINEIAEKARAEIRKKHGLE